MFFNISRLPYFVRCHVLGRIKELIKVIDRILPIALLGEIASAIAFVSFLFLMAGSVAWLFSDSVRGQDLYYAAVLFLVALLGALWMSRLTKVGSAKK